MKPSVIKFMILTDNEGRGDIITSFLLKGMG